MEKNNSHFSLDQIAATANYKSGLPSTRKYTTVDLGKPGPDDWFKGYDLGKGFDSFTTAWITNKKDAEGRKHPYLIAGPDEDFKADCVQRLKGTQMVHLYYGITSHFRPFIWPVVYVEDFNTALGWHATGLEIAKAGMTRWTQIMSDKANSRYIHGDLDNQETVPDYEVYRKPPIDYPTAINKAFRDRIISDENHPVYKNAGTIIESSYFSGVKKGIIKP